MKVPKKCRQKRKDGNDLAFVILNGTKHYLGAYNSPESDENYKRVLAEFWGTKKTPSSKKDAATATTVRTLVDAYLDYAKGYFVHRDGTPTGHYNYCEYVTKPLCELYGSTLTDKFGV